MKIQLWSIGKNHEAYVQAGIADFTRRIANYFPVEWKIIAPPRLAAKMSPEEQIRSEGSILLGLIKKEDCLVTLDEKGKPLSSVQLAGYLQRKANASTKNLVFLIGGAYGLDEAVLREANLSWSLSALTFPHQLVRLILAEQLYRACTILRNEKYHHA